MDNESRNAEFTELLTPNYYKIHGFILSLVPNKADAEDVLQAALTYMLEHFGDFRKGSNFLSWAFTISKYHVLTYRKKQQRSKIHFSEKAIELIESENQRLLKELDIRHDALAECMKKLSHDDETFVKKRFERSLSVKDLADEMGATVNVVYKNLSRIKRFLLSCIRRTIATGVVS